MTPHLNRAAAKIRGLVTRGRVIASTLNPKRTLLQLSGLAGETFNNVELFLSHGQSALPKVGAELVLVQVNGSRAHLIALDADDSALRITDLQAGEFGWKDYNARRIVFRSGKIEIVAPTGDVFITTSAGNVNINGVVIDKDGNITAPGTVTASGEGTFNGGHTVSQHTHSDPQGGSTGLPSG